MWYRLAAYGTIDLDKYISEALGENFDVEAEISNLITSSINNKNLDFKLLNESNIKFWDDFRFRGFIWWFI